MQYTNLKFVAIKAIIETVIEQEKETIKELEEINNIAEKFIIKLLNIS